MGRRAILPLHYQSDWNTLESKRGANMATESRTIQPFYWLLGSASFVVVIAGLRAAQSLVVPFLIAAFLAVICIPAFHWLKQKHVPVWLAMLIVVVAVSVVVISIFMVAHDSVTDFISQAEANQQSLRDKLQEELDTFADWLRKKDFPGFDKLADKLGDLENLFNFSGVIKFTTATLGGFLSVSSNVFLVLITVLFILMESSGFPQKLLALSGGHRGGLERAERIRASIVHYITLKTAVSLFTGILVWLMVTISGIGHAEMWGILAFILNYIPNIGSIIAAIPAVIMALIQKGFTTAILLAIGYAVINVVIGSVLEPRIMGKGLGLSTLVVFISLVFWGWVLGPVGMLFSVPLTMIVKIIMDGFDETRWIAILLGANPERAAKKS